MNGAVLGVVWILLSLSTMSLPPENCCDPESPESPVSTPQPESSPYREPTSSPLVERASSPYKDPASSPYNEPVSSPYKEPVSSPFIVEPASSPYVEPASSPYKEPKSSPFTEDAASPPTSDSQRQTPSPALSSASDGRRSPERKRLKYDDDQQGEQVPGSETVGPVMMAGSSHCASIRSGPQLSDNPSYTYGDTAIAVASTEEASMTGELLQPGQPNLTLRGPAAIDASQPENSSDLSDVSAVSDLSDESSISSEFSSVDSSTSESSSVDSSTSESSSSSSADSDSDDSDRDMSSDSCGNSDSGEGLLPKEVYEGGNLTVDEGFLCIMNLFMKNKLKKSLVGEILDTVLRFLPRENNMPKSRYLLFKYVRDLCPLSSPKIHYYCQMCQLYLGEEKINCSLCQSDCSKFIQLSLTEQLKNLFELHNLAEVIDKYDAERKERFAEGKYSDICDGTEFKRAWCGGKYLVLHGYTDGIALSDSSEVKLWPLEFIICQIPFHVRFRFVLICGIWVDSSKPLLNTYLVPFVRELTELYTNGVQWTHPQSKVQFVSKVSAPGFCGDAPVRAQAQEVQQHGGRHCCNMCEQKMVVCRCNDTQEKKRVFSIKEQESRLRTAERMDKHAKLTRKSKEANPGRKVKPCKGVKRQSILSKIPTCDRSKAVYPEYMHLLIGLIKGVFLKLWFKTNARDEWSLKAHQDSITSRLTSIKVLEHMRASRSIEDYPRWKASECRSFLLYYSLVVLSPFMKPIYLQHWLLFVLAVYLLLQDSVMEIDIAKAELLLRMFLRDFSSLYRAQDFTYNLHNLVHLGLTTRLYGPLQGSSAFMFESLNGDLRNCVHGTKNLAMELANTLTLFQGVQVLKSRVEAKNVCPETFINRNTVTLCNKVKRTSSGLRRVASNLQLSGYTFYYRGLIKGEAYTSIFYTRQIEKNNYTVCYLTSEGTKRYGEVYCFCVSSDDKKMVLINSFDIEHLRTFRHVEANVVVKHVIPVKSSDNFDLVPIESIAFKVLRVGDFVCCPPNKLEVNL